MSYTDYSLREVVGFCPMGCGETLTLILGGHVACSNKACPRPESVTDLLADGETEHIIMTDENTYSVMHPLRERLDRELLTCEFGRYLDTLQHPPVPGGRWRVVKAADLWTWSPA